MEYLSIYQALMRGGLDGFWVVTLQGRLLEVNDAYCHMIGYSREQLLTMGIADIDAYQSEDEIEQYMHEIKITGALRFETCHRASDGRLLDVEVSASYDAAQNVVFAFLRDITAKKMDDAVLQQRTHELSQRVKELRCLLDFSTLFARQDLSISDVMVQAVGLLPLGWQYPDLAVAKLSFPGVSFASENYRDGAWKLSCDLEVGEALRGQLSVCYLENPFDDDSDPFLPEERLLLDAIALRLVEFIQRRRDLEVLNVRDMSLNSLLDLSQRTSNLAERDIIQLALEEVERLTQSKIGYLHFVNADQNSIQLFTWSRNTLNQCTAVHEAHYPINMAGVWADCARLKRPVVHNDYQNFAGKKGYPQGHTHLVRHLSVPVVEDDSVKVILGVGNKDLEYDEADIRQLQLTAEHLWRIVRRKRAEEEARRETERVATLARVAARLNSHLELPAVLQTVCEEAARALDYPTASVYLYNEHATLALEAEWNQGTESHPGEILSILHDGCWENDILILPVSQASHPLRSLVGARLIHAGRPLGVLVLYDTINVRSRTDEGNALLHGLANQAAQAITNARLFTEISRNQDQLRILSRRLVEVQELERRHIARELHDEVGQVLTAVKINLQTLRRQPVLSNYTPRLDENIDSVQRAIQQVRNLSLDLRPSILDDLGLCAALEWYTHRVAQVADLNLHLTLPPDAPRWSPSVEITCFRVVQEALTNIMRHAGAHQVWVEVHHTSTELRVCVRDDGRGFDPMAVRSRAAQSGESVGLLSMAERVALAGGILEIISTPGNGATIQVLFSTSIL
jgi:PAS domain S-box-containing protein